jgi:HlyD family secretion protein
MMIDSKAIGPPPTPASRRWRGRIALLVLAGVVLAAFFLLPWSAWFGGEDQAQAATAEVKEVLRGDLVISVTTQGSLEAARSVSVISEIEGQAQILKIIEEGSRVRKGDWLCTLDTTNLESQREKQLLAVERAESAFLQAKASYNITLKQNESQIAQAELELTFARIELDKFLGVRRAWGQPGEAASAELPTETGEEKGDREVQIQEQQNRIQLAQAELENAKDVFEWSVKLHAKDYITKNELERDRISSERARLDLELAQARMRNLLDFDLRKQEKRLRADVREAELNLDRVKERCEQTRVQAQTDLTSKERQLELEKTQLERLDKQIASGRITAPQNGLVVYANESSNWRRGREDPISEGVSVRYHQKIITLPDVSEMIVEVSIHESARSLLWRGQQATTEVEALEGKVFKGTLTKVPEVPDSSSGWLTPDRKVYKTRIRIEDESPDIRPGMSALVTIYCEKIENTLYIPVQAVFIAGKDTEFVYVKSSGAPKARIVQVGKHNDKNVQVISGLKEGELVYLSEPPDAVPPTVSEEKHNGDRIPEGLKVSTEGRPPETASPGRRGGGSRGEGRSSAPRRAPDEGRSDGDTRGEQDDRGQQGESGERGERTGRGSRDPARFLEMIKERHPELWEEVKDLPQEEQMAKIRERLRALRGSRERDSGERGSGEPGGRPPNGENRNGGERGPRSDAPGGDRPGGGNG